METVLLIIMYGYFVYMNFLMFHMFKARKKAVLKKEVHASHFKSYQGEITERLAVIGNHFNNQFQMPIVFWIVCSVALSLNTVSSVTIALALAFFMSRLVHSYIFLTKNNVLKRAMAYGVGGLCVNALFLEIIIRSY
jgi:hypothetical protein